MFFATGPLKMLLLLAQILALCWTKEVPLSIARMASNLYLEGLEESVSPTTFPVKEWTIDWRGSQELDEDRSSVLILQSNNRQPAVDIKKLIEDILIDDGHDEESEDMDGQRGAMGRCSCCNGGPARLTSGNIIPSTSSTSTGTGKPQPEFNALVQTITDRFCSEMRQLGLEPMPITLRRRSVRETANLVLQQRQQSSNRFGSFLFKRSISSDSNDDGTSQDNRDGRSHNSPSTVRVKANLSGLTTLRPVGDVRILDQPLGRTLLKVATMAGPVKFTTEGSQQAVIIDELPGEMTLMLHPRGAGVSLHSFRFNKPAEVRTIESSSLQTGRFAGANSQQQLIADDLPSSITEAAVTRLLRKALRLVLISSRK